MLDRIEFLLGEALVSLRRNPWMSFAAITTSAMALFLLGGLAYAYSGLAGFVSSLGDRMEMKVFLKDSLPDEKAASFRDSLLRLPGVATVRYVPRDEGLKRFLAENPNIDVTGLLDDNPLPNAYVVRVRQAKDFAPLAASIARKPEVEANGVKYAAAEQDFLTDALRTMPLLGMTLGGLMLLTSGVLIYNAIRLTVLARRREIRIMQLVGATRAMVWTPMLIEGVIQGAFGGALATLVLWSAHNVVQQTVVRNLTAIGTMPAFPTATALAWLIGIGAAYGFVCSFVAVREPMQPRRRPA